MDNQRNGGYPLVCNSEVHLLANTSVLTVSSEIDFPSEFIVNAEISGHLAYLALGKFLHVDKHLKN